MATSTLELTPPVLTHATDPQGNDDCPACGHELHLSKPYAGLLQALRIVERRPRCGFSEIVQDALVDSSDDCYCEDGSHAAAVV